MDHMDNNKATPSKRTALENNSDCLDNDFNVGIGMIPEVEEANNSNATPSIPDEMPAREVR